MKNQIESLIQWFKETQGIPLSAKQINQFQVYLTELQKWNQQMNLIAESEEQEIVLRHFLDSLTCLQPGNITSASSLLDIGAGAGFPGLPLKIAVPDLKVTLVESIHKKCRFLEHIVAALELDQTQVICDRVEKLAHVPEYREWYDIVVTRALAKLAVAAELALPFVKVNGTYIAMLGTDAIDQIGTARMAISLCGGVVEKLIPIKLPQSEKQRYLLLITKTVHTPEIYPRRLGIPQKRPLVISK